MKGHTSTAKRIHTGETNARAYLYFHISVHPGTSRKSNIVKAKNLVSLRTKSAGKNGLLMSE